MATLREAIEQFEARMAVRDFERDPIRVVTAVALRTKAWRQHQRHQSATSYADLKPSYRNGSLAERTRQMAETGELLGIERVGLVVDQREVDRA
jgi:hypothetical protein